MKYRIIHPSDTGGVVVVTPILECGIPLEEIARKDVPAGLPYLIITLDQMPDNYIFFDAFEADFSNPHGYGIGPDAWFAEQANKGAT